MLQPLRVSPQITELAQNIGVPIRVNPVDGILEFCDKCVLEMMSDFPECETPAEMLDCVAGKVGIIFEEVWSDEDVRGLIKKYVMIGELGFVMLEEELSGDTYGITIRRQCSEVWRAF